MSNAKTKQVKTIKSSRNDYFNVDPRNIRFNPNNLRSGYNDESNLENLFENDESLKELSESIAAIGLQEPISATKYRGRDEYLLTEGHRRLAATLLAIRNGHDIKTIPVFPEKLTEKQMYLKMLTTGLGKKQLTPSEQAEGVHKLLGEGMDVKEIAKSISKSVPYVYNLINLRKAPQEVKQLMSEGKVSPTLVTSLMNELKTENGKVDKEALTNEVFKAVENAEKESNKKGTQKKATHRHAATRAKSVNQKLKELSNHLSENESPNAQIFQNLLKALKEKRSVEELVEMFK